MSKFSIKAKVRELRGRKTEELREQGEVPAIMYGFEAKPTSITLDRNTFNKLYSDTGTSSIINLEIDGVEHPVLIKDIQRHPLTDYVIHVDFHRIDMSKKVETTISIRLEGVSLAVKDLGGTLIQNLEEVEVISLPSALVREFVLDISSLKTFDDIIRVGDIPVKDGLEILTDVDRTIALVQVPRTQEEMESLDEEIEDKVAEVEGEIEQTEGTAEEATEEKKDEK